MPSISCACSSSQLSWQLDVTDSVFSILSARTFCALAYLRKLCTGRPARRAPGPCVARPVRGSDAATDTRSSKSSTEFGFLRDHRSRFEAGIGAVGLLLSGRNVQSGTSPMSIRSRESLARPECHEGRRAIQGWTVPWGVQCSAHSRTLRLLCVSESDRTGSSDRRADGRTLS